MKKKRTLKKNWYFLFKKIGKNKNFTSSQKHFLLTNYKTTIWSLHTKKESIYKK